MSDTLVLTCGDNTWLLFEGDYTIGRSQRNSIWIDAKGVSRQHCRIIIRGEECLIEDLGSSFGTLVNDKLMKEAILKPGDRIRLGDALLQIETISENEARAQSQSQLAPAEPIVFSTQPADADMEETTGLRFCKSCNLPNLIDEEKCVHCGIDLLPA